MTEYKQEKFGRLRVQVEQDGRLWRLTAYSPEGKMSPFSSAVTYPDEGQASMALTFIQALVVSPGFGVGDE